MVIVGTYSGNLIAFLSVDHSRLPFETYEELVEQTQYEFGTQGGTAWEEEMKVSKKIIFQGPNFYAS